MTLSDTFDLREIISADALVEDEARFETLGIEIDDPAAVDDERPEPSLAAAPFFIEFDEPARLDPGRAGLIWELLPPGRARDIALRSPIAALLFHLLPMIGLVIWPLLMVEPPPPIPVQLVFEQPPPPPPPPPAKPAPQQPPPKMVAGRLASVDQGDVKQAPDLGASKEPVEPAAGEKQPEPTETQTATTTPPPPVPMPKPAPPKEHQAAFQLPKPAGTPNTPKAEAPHEAPHTARYAGPTATKDEYLAYLVSLTKQHIGLLPLSYVGDRRGETIVSVIVYDNGVIGPLRVVRGSGYPDIDERIMQMVAAVRRAPPLPQWYQGQAVDLEFTLKFPDALERE